MPKSTRFIPVNTIADNAGTGISVQKMAIPDLRSVSKETSTNFEGAEQSHRHDGHSFFLLESGKILIEIDFQTYTITSPSILYVHPNQVHRTVALENLVVSSWSINNENLNPEYIKLLEEITPAKPLRIENETFSLISEMVVLCIRFSERKHDKLYRLLQKDSCNTLVALVISHYVEQSKLTVKLSRSEVITQTFKVLLEQNYTITKRPAEYAQKLNISTPYLNECVKNTTGYSVSHHIQQRILLEAKRLLYHSNQSVKEIAAALGYDDYPYFSRLFTTVTGMTALAFRNKNLD